MKKLIAALLIIVMLTFTLCACESGDNQTDDTKSVEKNSENVIEIAQTERLTVSICGDKLKTSLTTLKILEQSSSSKSQIQKQFDTCYNALLDLQTAIKELTDYYQENTEILSAVNIAIKDLVVIYDSIVELTDQGQSKVTRSAMETISKNVSSWDNQYYNAFYQLTPAQ